MLASVLVKTLQSALVFKVRSFCAFIQGGYAMKLSRRIVVAALSGLALVAGLSLGRAEEVTKQAEQELLLQQEKQKQIQAETDYLVRRMATMLRVLEFYQVDKAQEKKLMEEMVGTLHGLSKSQMNEVIRRLDAAAKEKEQGKSEKELSQAYARHREILDALKEMTAR